MGRDAQRDQKGADVTDLYLDHILIGVRDLDEASLTYSERLGFKLTPEGRHPGRGTHNRLAVFGPDYLELIAIHDKSLPAFRAELPPFLESREGLFMFAVGTRDIETAATAARANGTEVGEIRAGRREASEGAPAYTWRYADIGDATPGSKTFLLQHDQSVDERYTHPPQPAAHPNGAVGVRRLVLAVQDAESAAAEWRRALGLRRVAARPEAAATVAGLELGGCSLELTSLTGAGRLARHLDCHGESPFLLGLEVSDLAATRMLLQEEGVRVDDGGEVLTIDPRDSHGVVIDMSQARA